MNILFNQRGVSIIAVVATMLILSVMGVTLISMVTTGSDISINQMQSHQALNVAGAGREYVAENGTFPNYYTPAAVALGSGTFTVKTPTWVFSNITGAETIINVDSTAGFPAPGRIIIDSELIDYTGIIGNSFTGVTRGVSGTTASAHSVNNSVYPVTDLTGNLGGGGANVGVRSTTGFVMPSIIRIDSEYLYCAGTTPTAFTGCQRGYSGSSATTHTAGANVFQYILTSTGVAGDAKRVVMVAVYSNLNAGATVFSEPFPSGSVPSDAVGGNACSSDPALSWCYSYTNILGRSQYHIDNAPVSTGGSLEAESNATAGARFTGYRQKTLATNIAAGTNVDLSLWYKKVRGHSQANLIDMSVLLIATDDTSYQIWSNTQISNISWLQGSSSFIVPAGKTINRIRLSFDIWNKTSGGGSSNPSYVWFDEVSLAVPVAGVTLLDFREVY